MPDLDLLATAPPSCRLNVVVRSLLLYSWGGPKWRDNYPEGPDHAVVPNRLETFFRLAVHWPVAVGRRLFLFDWTLICSPSFTRLLIFLLFVNGNIHPNPGPAPVCPTNPKYPCSVCSREVGRTSIQCQCSRCKRWAHSTYSGLPVPTLRSLYSWGDVGGWVCSPCTAKPPHHCDKLPLLHCDYQSHCDSPMISLPQNIILVWTVPPPGFENCLPNARSPDPLPPPPPLFRITHSVHKPFHLLPPSLTIPTYSLST